MVLFNTCFLGTANEREKRGPRERDGEMGGRERMLIMGFPLGWAQAAQQPFIPSNPDLLAVWPVFVAPLKPCGFVPDGTHLLGVFCAAWGCSAVFQLLKTLSWVGVGGTEAPSLILQGTVTKCLCNGMSPSAAIPSNQEIRTKIKQSTYHWLRKHLLMFNFWQMKLFRGFSQHFLTTNTT